jgi:hypothetical protein
LAGPRSGDHGSFERTVKELLSDTPALKGTDELVHKHGRADSSQILKDESSSGSKECLYIWYTDVAVFRSEW